MLIPQDHRTCIPSTHRPCQPQGHALGALRLRPPAFPQGCGARRPRRAPRTRARQRTDANALANRITRPAMTRKTPAMRQQHASHACRAKPPSVGCATQGYHCAEGSFVLGADGSLQPPLKPPPMPESLRDCPCMLPTLCWTILEIGAHAFMNAFSMARAQTLPPAGCNSCALPVSALVRCTPASHL